MRGIAYPKSVSLPNALTVLGRESEPLTVLTIMVSMSIRKHDKHITATTDSSFTPVRYWDVSSHGSSSAVVAILPLYSVDIFVVAASTGGGAILGDADEFLGLVVSDIGAADAGWVAESIFSMITISKHRGISQTTSSQLVFEVDRKEKEKRIKGKRAKLCSQNVEQILTLGAMGQLP